MHTLQAGTSFKLQMLYMYCIYVHTHGVLSLTLWCQNFIFHAGIKSPPPSTLMAVQPFKGLTARHIYMSFGAKGLTSKMWYLFQPNFIVNIQHFTNCHYTSSNCSLIIHTLLVPFIFTTGINLLFVLGIVITSNRMDDASVDSMESLHNILTLHVT